MKKCILACILFSISTVSFAGAADSIVTPIIKPILHFENSEYSDSHTIERMYVGNDGWVFFGTSPQAQNTCDYYGFHFKFDSTSPGGKSMLALLLSAKIAHEKIDVWYSPSSTPETRHDSVCSSDSTAVSGIIGFH